MNHPVQTAVLPRRPWSPPQGTRGSCVSGRGEAVALRYENLDDKTRAYMLAEYDMDSATGRVYVCKRLSDEGRRAFPALLRQAIAEHDDAWLSGRLRALTLVTTYSGTGPLGIGEQVPEIIAEGEFNRYYMRGLCARAVHEGVEQLQVYRAKVVATRKTSLLQHIGQMVSPAKILAEFHTAHRSDPALASPYGADTGLSMRLV
jgi:hypothetical protein